MEAKELRLGNKVAGRIRKIYTVKEINENGVTAIHPNGLDVWLPYSSLSGILITPELLEKCGFKPHELDGRPILETGNLFSFGQSFAGNSVVLYWGEENTGHSVEFMHELQNLFFALTGEELTINP